MIQAFITHFKIWAEKLQQSPINSLPSTSFWLLKLWSIIFDEFLQLNKWYIWEKFFFVKKSIIDRATFYTYF